MVAGKAGRSQLFSVRRQGTPPDSKPGAVAAVCGITYSRHVVLADDKLEGAWNPLPVLLPKLEPFGVCFGGSSGCRPKDRQASSHTPPKGFFMSDNQRYEAAKAAWQYKHPHATPAEYQAAMRALASKLGV